MPDLTSTKNFTLEILFKFQLAFDRFYIFLIGLIEHVKINNHDNLEEFCSMEKNKIIYHCPFKALVCPAKTEEFS